MAAAVGLGDDTMRNRDRAVRRKSGSGVVFLWRLVGIGGGCGDMLMNCVNC